MYYITISYTYITEGLKLTVLSCTVYFELWRARSLNHSDAATAATDESIMKVAHRRYIFKKSNKDEPIMKYFI